jgi:hypothetical protein
MAASNWKEERERECLRRLAVTQLTPIADRYMKIGLSTLPEVSKEAGHLVEPRFAEALAGVLAT